MIDFGFFLVCLCLLCKAQVVVKKGTPPVWTKVQNILNGYDASVPPVGWTDAAQDGPKKINVELGFNVRKVLEINILEGTIKLNMWLRLKWLDERLLFDGPTDLAPLWVQNNLKFVPVEQGSVWLPDILPIGTTKNPFEDFLETHVYLYDVNFAKTNGYNIFWSRPGTIDGKCDVDLRDFPFDTQRCSLRFESWAFSDFLQLVPMKVGFLQSDEMPSNEDFELVEIVPELKTTSYNAASGQSTGVQVTIVARRLPHYFVVNAIMPLYLLMVLSAVTAWLAIDTSHSGSGERLSFSLTLLLTVFATMLFTAEKRPMLGHDTWLDQFQSWCVLLGTLPIFETAFIMWLDRHASMKMEALKRAHHEKAHHGKQHENSPEASYLSKMFGSGIMSGTTKISPREREFLATKDRKKGYCNNVLQCGGSQLAAREVDFVFRHTYPVFVFLIMWYKSTGMTDYKIIAKIFYHESLRSIGLFAIMGQTCLLLIAIFMIIRMVRQYSLGQPVLPESVRGWPGMDGFSDGSESDSDNDNHHGHHHHGHQYRDMHLSGKNSH